MNIVRSWGKIEFSQDGIPENWPPLADHCRDWRQDQRDANLYLTRREGMAESLRPLISAWVDVLCTSVLSTP